MAKQFKYAADKGIRFVAVIGESEMQGGTIALKDMKSGEQRSISVGELIEAIS
jgi:histidyl-tRNA synthetase